MLDRAQIPHLIRLLDDESPAVRELVFQELLSFGDELDRELAALGDSANPAQMRLLRSLIARRKDDDTRDAAWRRWVLQPELETGLDLLAWYQYGWKPPVRVGELLDQVAEEYLGARTARDPISLSRFLFVTKQFQGNQQDYYQPLNSNLIHVLQDRKGLPLSLCCVFMGVGQRVGIPVYGVDAPGHFLARSEMNDIPLFFDCFDGGRLLTTREVESLRSSLPKDTADRILTESPSTVALVRRVLRNLIHSYKESHDELSVAVFARLLTDLAPGVRA